MSAREPEPGAIRLSGMRFWGKHGADPGERERDQPIDVDLEISCDVSRAAASGALADTVDYAEVYRTCERIVTQESCVLLEELAGRIAAAVFADRRVEGLSVRVRKPRLLDGATPEVELRRRRTGT